MYRLHTHCRACEYGKSGASGIKAESPPRLIPVFDLGLQPLANDYRREHEVHAGYAPLKVLYCPRCSLAQLSVTVDPAILYRDYPYVTSPSKMMAHHFDRLIADIEMETAGRRVLEIGSNDGRLLELLKERGYGVLGVDPAANLAEIANNKGIPTVTGLFNSETARQIVEKHGQFPVIIARHVFCHIDDWTDFMHAINIVADTGALICIETPYAGDLLSRFEFDTIYHEHLSYLTIKAMTALLTRTGFKLHRTTDYAIHGGAKLWMITRESSTLPFYPDAAIADDFSENDWKTFSQVSHGQIGQLKAVVERLIATNQTVAGLGASAKSTVWINACGFTRKEISFIADNTPQKQWRMSPGNDIPVMDEGAILRDLPNYVVMWAWNYKAEILAKFSLARSKGVRFIVPVPAIEVV